MSGHLSGSALEQLAQAQAELQRHLVTGPDGRCLGCRQTEPCGTRERLEAVFALYGRLPRRRPGFTMAGRRAAAATERRSWFEG